MSKHSNYPFIRIPILWHKDSASLSECVVKTIELLLLFKFLERQFHKYLFAIGSSPVLGSSKNYIEGSHINELATHNFLLFPPLRCIALLEENY